MPPTASPNKTVKPIELGVRLSGANLGLTKAS